MSQIKASLCLFCSPYLPFLGHITLFLKRESDGKYLHLDRWGPSTAKWTDKEPADLTRADSRFDFMMQADAEEIASEWSQYITAMDQKERNAKNENIEHVRQVLFNNCASASERFLAQHAGVRMLPSAMRLPMDVFRAARSQIKTDLGHYNRCEQRLLAYARNFYKDSEWPLELSTLRCKPLLPMLKHLDALRLYALNYAVHTEKKSPLAIKVVHAMMDLARRCVIDRSNGSLKVYQGKFRLCMQTLAIDKNKLPTPEKIVKVVVNVLLAIVMAGVLYLAVIGINRCVTGHWLLFGKPHAQGLKEKILRSIDALAPDAPNP